MANLLGTFVGMKLIDTQVLAEPSAALVAPLL
jgi:hypothetical protein